MKISPEEKARLKAAFLQERLQEPLPDTMHGRVINALWGDHSKQETDPPPGIERRDSGVLQLRTQTDILLHFRGGRVIHCREEMEFAGAVLLNENALEKLKALEYTSNGAKVHIVTIENEGAWQHFPLPDGIVAVFMPGNNQKLAKRLFSFTADCPWTHFGDLDQKGIDIPYSLANALGKSMESVKLLIPDWWQEYRRLFDLSVRQPWKSLTRAQSRQSPLLKSLKSEKKWLEQEAIVLDKRFYQAVQALIEKSS